MAPLEIIGAGYGRTGTDSLRTALNMLGYKTHHMKSFWEDPSLDPNWFTEAYNDRKNAQWDKMYENYNAAVDWPTASYWKELHEYYPNAKVILTVRPADSWYTSMKNTIAAGPPPEIRPLLRDPNHPRASFFRMVRTHIMDGHLNGFENKEEHMKQLYLDNIEEAKRIIPEDQLLVLNLGEGWERLCQFLGKEVPNEPYPKTNTTAEHNQFMKEKRAEL